MRHSLGCVNVLPLAVGGLVEDGPGPDVAELRHEWSDPVADRVWAREPRDREVGHADPVDDAHPARRYVGDPRPAEVAGRPPPTGAAAGASRRDDVHLANAEYRPPRGSPHRAVVENE